MIERFMRRFAVWVLAFAMAHTDQPLRPALDLAFRHRDEEWRDEVFKDAWKRMTNRMSRA